MPDYIQLLESKLSPIQKQALNAVTELARARGITVFLTGGAVRDIVSGASVRDLDITVQANPLKFRKELEKAGFSITGEHEPSQTLYLRYGRQARLEISVARTETFLKPARAEYQPSAIIDDLHRRDFTANAMALSLNEGSWGLLLDPLNGSADIYSRQLRLVSNYGFLEDPIRMVRATRLQSRTGWEMEERTKARYENAKAEGVISAITPVQRGYEMEEIAYEEDPLQVIRALEAEGWMEHLSPIWTSRAADAQGIERLHERLVQLLMAGLHPDASAAQFRLLTAKLSPAQLATLKKMFVRRDLLDESESLDTDAKKVLQQMTSKDAAKPSQLWKLLHNVKPEAVLWLFFSGKGSAVQNRFESFFSKWPEARQKIPNAVLQDMRILPDVPGYDELLDKLTFAFMDAELPDEAAIRKFAEPYSPPAPPPPVVVRRSRAVKRVVEPRGSKGKGKKAGKKAAEAAESVEMEASEDGIHSEMPGDEQPALTGSAAPTKPEAKPSRKRPAVVESPAAGKTATAKSPASAAVSKDHAKPAAELNGSAREHKAAAQKTAPVKAAAKPGKPAAKVSGPAHKAGLSAKRPALAASKKGATPKASSKATKPATAKAGGKAPQKSSVKGVGKSERGSGNAAKPAVKHVRNEKDRKAAPKPAKKAVLAEPAKAKSRR